MAQYYNFLRFGKKGYRQIMNAVMHNAHTLEKALVSGGHFTILTDTKYLPVVVVALKDDSKFTVYDISRELRRFGWIIPAYSLPAHAENIHVLRMVIKENFSHDLAEKLLADIKLIIHELDEGIIKPQTPKKIPHTSKVKPHPIC